MTKIQSLRLIACFSAALVLSACGGGGGAGGNSTGNDGGGNGSTARPDSPFASAAMYVPTGQTSKSFVVSGCTRFVDSVEINSANVAIQANGDMVFSGAIGGSGVAELARINYAATDSRNVYGNTDLANVGFQVDYYKPDGSYMNLYSYNSVGGFRSSSPSVSFECTNGPSTTTMSLQQTLSQARIASSIVAGSTGSVQISPSGAINFTQTGNIVSWDTGNTATFSRFASFNLDTAQFGQGNSLNSSTHASIPFALPSIGSAVIGYYEEFLGSNGDKTIYFTHDNIDIRYRRYADPTANGGVGRQFRMYSSSIL